MDLDFTFRLPGQGEPLVGCGRVVRRAAEESWGVEFYALEGDGSGRIGRFVGR
jgi:hypothetical protein